MKIHNQNLKKLLTQGKPDCLTCVGSLSELQMQFIKILKKEIGVLAIEFLTVVNPSRQIDEQKITNHYFAQIECLSTNKKLLTNSKWTLADLLHHLRVLNKKGQDIYFRPSYSQTGKPDLNCCIQYSYFVLDDVNVELANDIAKHHRCLLVKTSKEGGCQVWVFTNRPVDIRTRYLIQQHFAKSKICDMGATSGTQYFRCAGFKNYKRDGQWVNLIHSPKKTDKPFNVDDFLIRTSSEQAIVPDQSIANPAPKKTTHSKIPHVVNDDQKAASQSEIDWNETCQKLRAGIDIELLIAELNDKSIKRGKHHTYAARTVNKAARSLGILQ